MNNNTFKITLHFISNYTQYHPVQMSHTCRKNLILPVAIYLFIYLFIICLLYV